ncbi:hypothetical protein D3C87_1404080 [compost metagenome]
MIAHGGSRVIGGADCHSINRLAHGNRLACRYAEFKGNFRRSILRHDDPVVPAKTAGAQSLKGQIEGHHFRQRGRMIDGLRILRGKHLPALHIIDVMRITGLGRPAD